MESPTIIRSLGNAQPFDVNKKVADRSTQTISNKESYDALYPSHSSWYDEKKFVVLDKHFDDVENYLLKDFKEALNKHLDFSQTKNIQHVDDLDKTQIKLSGLEYGNMPKFNAQALESKSKYTDNFTAGQVKVSSSNPYGEIFGGKYSGN